MSVPNKTHSKEDPTPFPELGKLDMSGNPLNMDVWDFLYPLANNYYLSVVIASGCNLTGEVAGLHVIQIHVMPFAKSCESTLLVPCAAKVPGIFSYDNYPLYWQPKYMDLSNNSITALRGQPRRLFLDASRNPINHIDSKYFTVPLVLNIADTPYNVTEDTERALVGSG